MFRLQLLKNLCTETPNAYVLIGEKYYPTRSELFNFEMFRLARKTNMFKFHNKLPIILTLEEDQLSIYEQFEKYLIFDTPLKFGSPNQIDFILFLKSICSDREIENILKFSANYCKWKLFTLTTWIELMEYGLDPFFMTEYERVEICVAIHRGQYEFDEKGDYNCYGYKLSKIQESTLEQTDTLLHKALKFYEISLKQLREKYTYKNYGYSSHGSN